MRRHHSLTTLTSKLERNLTAYVAVSAAGGALIAATPSAEAKVVYTQANTPLTSHNVVLDLNNDGFGDFSFSQIFYGHWQHFYFSPKVTGNAVVEDNFPLALHAGLPIGPARQFSGAVVQLLAKYGSTSGFAQTTGNWNNVTNRYLLLKFLINGQVHYRWARITATGKGGTGATLTGYAYETIPNKGILSGQTSGTDEVASLVNADFMNPAPQQPVLGLLAHGADAMSLWRREGASSIEG